MKSPIFAARTWNEVDDAVGHADFAQEIDEPRSHDRRIARRLEHDGIARDDRRRRHPDHDRRCKVPGRNYRSDAERNIDELVALAVDRDDGVRLGIAQRFARVELEEIDRFGNVGVGFDPALPTS